MTDDVFIVVALDDAIKAMHALCREVESYGDNLEHDSPRWPALEAATRIAIKVREAGGYSGPYINGGAFNDAIVWLCTTGLVTARTGRERGEAMPPMPYGLWAPASMPGDGIIDLPVLRHRHASAPEAGEESAGGS